jgi:hypothetical protein
VRFSAYRATVQRLFAGLNSSVMALHGVSWLVVFWVDAML